MIEEYVPPDHHNDDYYERFMEQRAQDLNIPSTTDEHGSFSFPIEPLRSISSQIQRKQLDTHGGDSGVNSPLAFSQSPVLSLPNPIDTSTPQPFPSQPAHAAQSPPKGAFSPIQQFIRNNAKLRCKEPKCNCSQPIQPDRQSVLRICTQQGQKF